jgi:hypothetical protein
MVGGASDRSAVITHTVATNGLWLAGFVTSLSPLMAAECSALVLELIHTHRWERGRGMMMSLVMMNFVDRYGRVNNVWLNSLYTKVSPMLSR